MRISKHPFLIAGAIFAFSGSIRAQSRDPAAADALFQAGRALAKKGDFAAACPKFAESHRLDPAAGTLLNLAECEERAGKLASAWQSYAQARDMMQANDDRLAFTVEHITSLQRRLPKLVVRAPSRTPGMRIVRDGSVELGEASLGVPIPVDPGSHTLEVTTPNNHAARFQVNVHLGETREIEVAVGPPLEARPAEVRAVEAPRADAPSPDSTRRTLQWVSAGVGVAGLTVGAVTGIMALDAASTYKAHCTPKCDATGLDAASSGQTLSVLSPVAFGVGLVGAAGFVYFTFFSKGGGATVVGADPIHRGVAIRTSF